LEIQNKIYLALGIALVLSFVGCAPTDNEFNRTGMNNTQDRLNTSLNNPMDDTGLNNGMNNGINNGLNNGMTRMNNNVGNNDQNSKANDIAKRIGELPEVDSASVVINGDTVLVGIRNTNKNTNTKSNMSTTTDISNNLKTKINKIVKEAGFDTTNIQITSDPDLFNRIEDVSKQTVNSIGNLGRDVLDEINVALSFGLISWPDLEALLDAKAPETEVVLTGRGATPELIAKAQLVTEMKEIKHYYNDLGLEARVGIES